LDREVGRAGISVAFDFRRVKCNSHSPFPVLMLVWGQTEIGPAILTSVLPSTQTSPTRRSVRKWDIAPRLAEFGLLASRKQAHAENMRQKIRLQPCIDIRDGAHRRRADSVKERRSCNGDAADAARSCLFAQVDIAFLLRDLRRGRRRYAESNSSRRRINKSKSPKLRNDWGPSGRKTPRNLTRSPSAPGTISNALGLG